MDSAGGAGRLRRSERCGRPSGSSPT